MSWSHHWYLSGWLISQKYNSLERLNSIQTLSRFYCISVRYVSLITDARHSSVVRLKRLTSATWQANYPYWGLRARRRMNAIYPTNLMRFPAAELTASEWVVMFARRTEPGGHTVGGRSPRRATAAFVANTHAVNRLCSFKRVVTGGCVNDAAVFATALQNGINGKCDTRWHRTV